MARRKPMSDKKRSGYGLGWVYAERGLSLRRNPCRKGTMRFDEFVVGWNEYFKRAMAASSEESAKKQDGT